VYSFAILISMNIDTYLKVKNISQSSFAELIGVSLGMVNQWISGHRPISPEKCVTIEKATQGKVTRKDLRPDDWHLIWPELVDAA